ncbi:uncharacterized protein VTP21DRAFT_8347 [Calcarisporiella thermophila]|uniref:uncharacterized protein n=1 Tax=Calcarisporiella thermophila TaxID=911321 RepID=UPI0037447BDC
MLNNMLGKRKRSCNGIGEETVPSQLGVPRKEACNSSSTRTMPMVPSATTELSAEAPVQSQGTTLIMSHSNPSPLDIPSSNAFSLSSSIASPPPTLTTAPSPIVVVNIESDAEQECIDLTTTPPPRPSPIAHIQGLPPLHLPTPLQSFSVGRNDPNRLGSVMSSVLSSIPQSLHPAPNPTHDFWGRNVRARDRSASATFGQRSREGSSADSRPVDEEVRHIKNASTKSTEGAAELSQASNIQLLHQQQKPPKEPTPPPQPGELRIHCTVCLEIPNNVAATVCGHLFCEECIYAAISASKRCPVCRRKLTPGQVEPLEFKLLDSQGAESIEKVVDAALEEVMKADEKVPPEVVSEPKEGAIML